MKANQPIELLLTENGVKTLCSSDGSAIKNLPQESLSPDVSKSDGGVKTLFEATGHPVIKNVSQECPSPNF